jgi:putative hydrolase of the HAD superfamily
VKIYKHIFFDLDHTLWDYERNSIETLNEMHSEFSLSNKNIPIQKFIDVYRLVNAELWRAYNSAKINKDELRDIRFYKTLGHLGIKDKGLSIQLEDTFMEKCPNKPHVLPNTFEILDYLKQNYQLHIITNGFAGSTEEKLNNSKIRMYFDEIITSESIGITKPHSDIFKHALNESKAISEESIMIGDNLETDIKGAMNAGLDHIFYNPKKRKHTENVLFEVSDLIEIKLHL